MDSLFDCDCCLQETTIFAGYLCRASRASVAPSSLCLASWALALWASSWTKPRSSLRPPRSTCASPPWPPSPSQWWVCLVRNDKLTRTQATNGAPRGPHESPAGWLETKKSTTCSSLSHLVESFLNITSMQQWLKWCCFASWKTIMTLQARLWPTLGKNIPCYVVELTEHLWEELNNVSCPMKYPASVGLCKTWLVNQKLTKTPTFVKKTKLNYGSYVFMLE